MTYPSDLTDSQWDLIKGHFDTGNYGKSRKHDRRSLVNKDIPIQLEDAVFRVWKGYHNDNVA